MRAKDAKRAYFGAGAYSDVRDCDKNASATKYFAMQTRRKSLLFRFHGGEQYHIPYRCAVGEKHDQTIYAHAQAARGG